MDYLDDAAVRMTIQACLGLCDIGYPGRPGASGLSSPSMVACPTIFPRDSLSCVAVPSPRLCPYSGSPGPARVCRQAERSEPLPGREVPSTPPVGVGMAPAPGELSDLGHPGACPSGEDKCS